MSLTSQKEFNDFLKDNALWLCLAIVAVIVIILAIALIAAHRNRQKGQAKAGGHRVIDATAYVTALGGKENIVSHQLVRSRIVLELANYELVDKEKLKEAGVDGFIMMSDKLTLVIKGDAAKVNETIFGE